MSTEPRHGDHPFEGAVFLGHSEEYDIWVYPREAREGTRCRPRGYDSLVLRFGSEPCEYASYPEQFIGDLLDEASVRARPLYYAWAEKREGVPKLQEEA